MQSVQRQGKQFRDRERPDEKRLVRMESLQRIREEEGGISSAHLQDPSGPEALYETMQQWRHSFCAR